MNGLVSVIVPIFNREQYIKDCINSCLSQSYKNFEVIIVDDGSTDKTSEICKEFTEKDKRIKYIQKEHSGISATRNRAIEESAGEYLFFLDSDDTIHPSLLEDLVYGLETENADISATKIYLFPAYNYEKSTQREIEGNPAPGTTQFKTNSEAISAILGSDSPINLIGGVMMRRSLIGNTRFNTEFFIGEDFLFIYENLIKGGNVAFLNETRYYSRIHNTNISYNGDYAAFCSRFKRRLLVWQSEEKLGRPNNAKIQKRDAFSCYSSCLQRIKPYSQDAKQMRKVVKEYKKDIFPALNWKIKILFLLALYMPFTYTKLIKIKK